MRPADSFRRRYREQFLFEKDLLPTIVEPHHVAILVVEVITLNHRSAFGLSASAPKAWAYYVTDGESRRLGGHHSSWQSVRYVPRSRSICWTNASRASVGSCRFSARANSIRRAMAARNSAS